MQPTTTKLLSPGESWPLSFKADWHQLFWVVSIPDWLAQIMSWSFKLPIAKFNKGLFNFSSYFRLVRRPIRVSNISVLTFIMSSSCRASFNDAVVFCSIFVCRCYRQSYTWDHLGTESINCRASRNSSRSLRYALNVALISFPECRISGCRARCWRTLCHTCWYIQICRYGSPFLLGQVSRFSQRELIFHFET